MLIVRSAHEELRRWLTEVCALLVNLMHMTDLSKWNKPDRSAASVHDAFDRSLTGDSFSGPANPSNEYDSRAQFYYAYSSLVLYSFGLENALEVSSEFESEVPRQRADESARKDGHFVLLAECV
jgi:hypothetical protein